MVGCRGPESTGKGNNSLCKHPGSVSQARWVARRVSDAVLFVLADGRVQGKASAKLGKAIGWWWVKQGEGEGDVIRCDAMRGDETRRGGCRSVCVQVHDTCGTWTGGCAARNVDELALVEGPDCTCSMNGLPTCLACLAACPANQLTS